VWDSSTGIKIRAHVGAHKESAQQVGVLIKDAISALVFAPDGSKLVSVGMDKSVSFWACDAGQILKTKSALQLPQYVVNPDASLVLTTTEHAVTSWSAISGQVVATRQSSSRTSVLNMNDELLLTGHEDGTVTIWGQHGSEPVHITAAHESRVESIVIPPPNLPWLRSRGPVFISTDRHSSKVWSLETGEAVSCGDFDPFLPLSASARVPFSALGMALSNTLARNTTLTSLNVSRNKLGSNGTRALCVGLRQNSSLTALKMAGNGAGRQGGQALASVLRKHPSLSFVCSLRIF
jgi:WD40 repeat protein